MEEEKTKEIIEVVKATIVQTVNGKIDNLAKKIDDHIEKDDLWKKTADLKLDKIQPVSDGFWAIKLVGGIVGGTSKFLLASAAIIGITIALIKFAVNQ